MFCCAVQQDSGSTVEAVQLLTSQPLSKPGSSDSEPHTSPVSRPGLGDCREDTLQSSGKQDQGVNEENRTTDHLSQEVGIGLIQGGNLPF